MGKVSVRAKRFLTRAVLEVGKDVRRQAKKPRPMQGEKEKKEEKVTSAAPAKCSNTCKEEGKAGRHMVKQVCKHGQNKSYLKTCYVSSCDGRSFSQWKAKDLAQKEKQS